MRKFLLAVGAAAAAGAAAVTLGVGSGNADPAGGNSTLNVVGEPYAKAVAILRAQGVATTFGGAVGDDVPQAQCIVASQKVLSASRKMQLNLNCSAAAQPQKPAGTSAPSTSGAPQSTSGAPQSTEATARPTPGAPGVVTVVPKPVG